MYCSMEHILSRYSKGIDLECQTNPNEEHGVPEVSITAHSYVFIQKLKCGVRTHISYLHSIKNSKNVNGTIYADRNTSKTTLFYLFNHREVGEKKNDIIFACVVFLSAHY